MDRDHKTQIPHAARGSIPRLSRLPMPRAVASVDNLRLNVRTPATATSHQDDLRKTSHLPRPAGPKDPLRETINYSIRSRYGWSDNAAKERSISPVRDALRDAQTTTLETTPPSSDSSLPAIENGNENPVIGEMVGGVQEHKAKRRPRPSLSERTIETLSQVSPCPSPQARSGLFANDGKMFPPLRPASSMRDSRPTSPVVSRSESPSRPPFRPPGRLSPTKDMVALPPVMSSDDVYTPPRAFVKGQRSGIAKSLRLPTKSTSNALQPQSQDATADLPFKGAAQTMKAKPYYGKKNFPSNNATAKPSLSSIFQDPASDRSYDSSLAVSTTDKRHVLPKPGLGGQNVTTPVVSPSARGKSRRPPTASKLDQKHTSVADSRTASGSPNSSAALREAVAKAKAARRKGMSDAVSTHAQSSGTTTFAAAYSEAGIATADDNKGRLKRHIEQAVSIGHLNIAGLKLPRVPAEVMKMYESDSSRINWAEMVDLVKLNAADNEIEELEGHIFPDYTVSDLADNDEKTNIFGGLELIDLRRNSLRQLPVGLRRLERLQILELTNNRLTNEAIDIACQIPQLRELMIGGNLINGSFSFSGDHFEQLQILDLHDNQLERFDVDALSQLRALKVLNAAGNQLTELPWETLSTLPLTELNVSKNCLSGTLFRRTSSLHTLRRLDVSYNDLGLVFEGELDLPDLRSLLLDGNRIAELPDFTNCRQLQTLGAAENQLEDIPPTFVSLESLKSADFGHNNIRLINPEVANMKNLSSLNLAGNPIREKKYLKMSATELKMDLEKRLTTPQVGTQPRGPESHQGPDDNHGYHYKPSNGILDLSSRGLATISPEEIDLNDSDVAIHTVKLSNNELSGFPSTLLSHPALKYSVRSLDLSHNPLFHPTDYLSSELFLPNLKSLYIVSTGLTSLDALTTHLKAPALTELNISCHRLSGRVPWVRAWWPSCHTLLATDNWFTTVEVEGVRGLQVLDIRNNEIDSLPPKIGLFGNHPGAPKAPDRLRVLEVSGNKFRVPRLAVLEKGTEAVLQDLRRMVPEQEMPEEWKDAV
ncbi:hypothetical protein A1O1_02662 [Capronia coronata CBS 617.96]|uniref:Leucine-rich repeat-containing protein 40 n=1 Tax=Capronia coronata CBS 617.96 TaxID=1182541 RepID=W9ZID2_9EURO|nr:uncharacterized protein A1O1_02662 [Capronia coronata CBS 617.96]EXJ94269.1 hypothetical protein A1O1_02662 [Capronia coronata CBS 617.96]